MQAKHWIGFAVIATAGLGVLASVGHYLQPSYNPGFANYPWTVGFHVVLGGIYLALAPWQFSARLRKRNLAGHRLRGRIATGAGVITGVAAMAVALLTPFSGNIERLLITPFAAYFLFALCRGIDAVRVHNIESHRRWMIRTFAIGSSIATMRLVFGPALMIVGEPSYEEIQFFSMASFLLAFAIHGVVAEWWIRRTEHTADELPGRTVKGMVGAS